MSVPRAVSFACLLSLGVPLVTGSYLSLKTQDAQARASYFSLEELVARADAIAVVDTGVIDEIEVEGSQWTYRQRAHVTRSQLIKGDLGRVDTILAEADFRCAMASYLPRQRYLVFLARDQVSGEFVTLNYEAGNLPVDRDQTLEWFYGDTFERRLLADVVAELHDMLPPMPPLEHAGTQLSPEGVADVDPDPWWLSSVLLACGAFAVVLGFGVASRRLR